MTLVQPPPRKRRGLKKERPRQMKERTKSAGLSRRPHLDAAEMKRTENGGGLLK